MTTKITLDKIRKEIETASHDWTGWEWAQGFGAIVLDGMGPEADWDEWEQKTAEKYGYNLAHEARGYGESCQDDAESAAEKGETAMEALAKKDYQGALRHLQAAVSLEREYGDAHSWGPVLQAVKEYIEERNE